MPFGSFAWISTFVNAAINPDGGPDEEGCWRTYTWVDVVPSIGAAVGAEAAVARTVVTGGAGVGCSVAVMMNCVAVAPPGVEGLGPQPAASREASVRSTPILNTK